MFLILTVTCHLHCIYLLLCLLVCWQKLTVFLFVFLFQLYVCEHVLEQEGVYGYVEIEELQIELIPLDRDILSLEIPEFFRSFYLVCIPQSRSSFSLIIIHEILIK